jgi:hypothetical protein
VALRDRDELGWDLANLTVGWATCAPGGALVVALLADVDDVASLGTLFGSPVVRAPEFVECWGFGLEVRAAFFVKDRVAHGRYSRQ